MSPEQEIKAMSRTELEVKHLELIKERDELKKDKNDIFHCWTRQDVISNASDNKGIELTEEEVDEIVRRVQKGLDCGNAWDDIDNMTDEVVRERD